VLHRRGMSAEPLQVRELVHTDRRDVAELNYFIQREVPIEHQKDFKEVVENPNGSKGNRIHHI
jgi:hypothetical protein